MKLRIHNESDGLTTPNMLLLGELTFKPEYLDQLKRNIAVIDAERNPMAPQHEKHTHIGATVEGKPVMRWFYLKNGEKIRIFDASIYGENEGVAAVFLHFRKHRFIVSWPTEKNPQTELRIYKISNANLTPEVTRAIGNDREMAGNGLRFEPEDVQHLAEYLPKLLTQVVPLPDNFPQLLEAALKARIRRAPSTEELLVDRYRAAPQIHKTPAAKKTIKRSSNAPDGHGKG